MGILNKMFNWLSTKDYKGEEINLGYVLESEPQTNEDLKKVFVAFELEKYFSKIEPLIRPKISLELSPKEEKLFQIGSSKIGGKPHLENSQKWPKNENNKSLSFIAQLNFEEVSQLDKSDLLPKKGIASFFYCADQEVWGFDPKDINRFKVLFTENNKELSVIEFPSDIEEHSIFNPNEIKFNSSLSIPTWQEDSIEDLIEEDDSDNYCEISSGSDNQILGYANPIQNTMELECQLVTNGLFCGDSTGYEDPKREQLEKGKEDWVLLLQIDSEDNKTGMMWGDSGRIYFWIKKQDLLKKDFGKTWCILQCY